MTTTPLPDAASDPPSQVGTRSAGSSVTGAAVTAAAALVAGLFVVFRPSPTTAGGQTDYSAFAWFAIGLGAAALLLAALGSYEWTAPAGEADRWRLIRAFFGNDGSASRLSTPVGWLSAAVAAVVVATIAVPQLVPSWKTESVFAVSLLALLLLAILGWGPAVTRSLPSGFRLSTLTVLGSVVALALVGAYLFFLLILSSKTGANADEWARLVEIRATLEALAFAAAGALIGQTVTRTAVTAELSKKDATIDEQTGQLAAKDQIVKAKDDALAGALNNLTPDDTEITPGTFNFLDVARLGSVVAPQSKLQDARRKLAEGLQVGR